MKEQFEIFRQLYPGVKRGLETEFRVFTRHKDASSGHRNAMPSLRLTNQGSTKSKGKR
jgi:hypothetical protein